MKMILLALVLSAPAFGDSFSKVKPPNILSESKAAAVTLESGLQPLKARSSESLSIQLGTPTGVKNVGPALQADWTYRFARLRPLFLTLGMGYMQETGPNQFGHDRNFHHIPIHALGGYQGAFTRNWGFLVSAGPSVRHIFERGYTSSQNESYSYGDLMSQIGLEYSMHNSITGSQQAFGLRHSRYFGLAGSVNAPAQDIIFGSFAFDL